jgi:type II secretory pathway component PulF
MKIKEKLKNFFARIFGRISTDEKIFLVQQLGIMTKTGISLAVALQTLAEQTTNKRFKAILTDLKQEVEKGRLLSKGLEKYQKIFGELFINMIKSGEASGKLEEVLNQLFIQMKKDRAIISKVKGAMIYPSIVIVAMVIVATVVVTYVIPSLTSIFEEINAPLPLATRALIGLSHFVTSYGIYIYFTIAVVIIATVRFISLPKGKYIWHQILLNLPVAGPIIQKINLARFCRTLSSLLKTDIAIVKSFQITSNVLGNRLYKRALLQASERVKKGESVKVSLDPYKKLFPPVVLQMINVGEETGSLDTILEEAAMFYEEDINRTMTNLPSIIEPILIVILGAGVAVMAVAIIMPMYSLSQQI